MASEGGAMAGNTALAFGMVCGAGACTSLGAAAAFVVNLESKRFLAVSLALSCGVMFYVSMVEIFVKSLGAFSDEFCGTDRLAGEICARGYGATTGFFFLGLALTAVLNVLTSTASLEFLCGKCGFVFAGSSRGILANPTSLSRRRSGRPHDDAGSCSAPGECERAEAGGSQPETQPLPPGWEVRLAIGSLKPFFYHPVSNEFSWGFPGLKAGAHCPCDGPVDTHDVELKSTQVTRESLRRVDEDGVPIEAPEPHLNKDLERNHPEVEDQAKLNATGLLTGLAIAIHNFPEGLATFVAAMADPSLGAAIAVAIAIHNIPEGVCVAMPIYYSTGSKLRAFMWATLSGVSEPVGALFGYLVLGGDVSNMAYGSMFGIVAGMMVYISLAELLPSAYRFEKNPAVVTASMVSGMVIMALSLIAFQV